MNRSKTFWATLGGAAAGALAAWAALPAGTPPVRIRKNKSNAKSIAVLEPIPVNGAMLWTLQRGADTDNPIILYVHGGPGMSELTMNRSNTKELEQHFTIVNFDQRGAGKSYQAIHDESRMNMPQFVEDIAAVARYLLQKFGRKKLTLLGRSWGTSIGMLAIAKYPELFDAYVGIGQIARTLEGEFLSYQWALDQSIKHNDRQATQDLVKMGPPPFTGDWLKKFMTERKYVCRYGGEVVGNPHGGNLKMARYALVGQEYTIADRLVYFRAAKQSLRLLQPQLMELDLFETVPEVKVPVFFMAGRNDYVVPQQVAQKYYLMLSAPHKEWHWFERSAHMVDFEEREKFIDLMLTRLRPFAIG